MTLEEAIKHCEEVAEKNEEECKTWTYGASQINDDENRKKQFQKHAEWWHERAKEHRQLAEWLRELKAYKDFEDKGYVMCRFEVAQDDRHRTTKMVLDFSTRELFDNIGEVNADDSIGTD